MKPPASSILCPPATEIRRHASGPLTWTELDTGSTQFFHLTGRCAPGTTPGDSYARLGEFLRQHDARPVFHDEFRACPIVPEWRDALSRAGIVPNWPVTWLEGHESPAGLSNGFQIEAVAGPEVEPITHKGRIVGRRFEDDEATWLALGDLRPENPDRSRPDQSAEVFDSMIDILAEQGMDFDQVVRTWLYLDHILEWYDDFNRVRNAFFEKHGIFDRLVPASTGIGCAHPAGTAMVAKLLAVRPKSGGSVSEVESPLQCPATEYRSSFSRAVEVALPSHRKLYISGSASIEPGGLTIHIDDTAAQIELTMRVVAGILESRGMDWNDTTRAVAYLRHEHERPLLADWLARHGLGRLPLVVIQSDVCRDDLLYEIEIDAVRASAGS